MNGDIRIRTCPTCGNEFSYPKGTGRDKKHCSRQCRQKFKIMLRNKRMETLPFCSIPGCKNKAQRVKYGLCETHYYRLRRTGTTDVIPPKRRYMTREGYVKILSHGHVLADKAGHVYEHRKVLFDDIGPGKHSCFWCGVVLDWDCGIVDHLNDKKSDNRLENLVFTCNNCNRARGALIPFLRRMKSISFPVFITSCNTHIGVSQ